MLIIICSDSTVVEDWKVIQVIILVSERGGVGGFLWEGACLILWPRDGDLSRGGRLLEFGCLFGKV